MLFFIPGFLKQDGALKWLPFYNVFKFLYMYLLAASEMCADAPGEIDAVDPDSGLVDDPKVRSVVTFTEVGCVVVVVWKSVVCPVFDDDTDEALVTVAVVTLVAVAFSRERIILYGSMF